MAESHLVSLRRRIAGRLMQWKGISPRNFLAILNFHQVTPTFDPTQHWPGNWTALEQFRQTVRFLQNKYEIVRLDEGLKALDTGSLRGRCVALTFDDGDISVQQYVIPLLQDQKAPAAFFLCTSYDGPGKAPWGKVYIYLAHSKEPAVRQLLPPEIREKGIGILRWAQDPSVYQQLRRQLEAAATALPATQPMYISLEEASRLDESLFLVGLHGHEHGRFSMMSAQEQEADLRQNIGILSRLPAYRPLFAVPYGQPRDWNDDTVRICLDLKLKVLTAHGAINLDRDIRYDRIPSDALRVSRLLRQRLRKAF